MWQIVQLTDLHLFEGNPETYGIYPKSNLEKILAGISQMKPLPQFVVLTGDLGGKEGKEAEYATIHSLLQQLSFPVYAIPGNHDTDQVLFQKYFIPPQGNNQGCYWTFCENGFRFIGLDSSTGAIPNTQLKWLQDQLDSPQPLPIIVFIHHHILPVGIEWLDQLLLENALELLNLLCKYKEVQHIFNGHVHMEKQWYFQEKHVWASPATSWQFSPYVQTFALDGEPPGYRVIQCDEARTLKTWVERVYIP